MVTCSFRLYVIYVFFVAVDVHTWDTTVEDKYCKRALDVPRESYVGYLGPLVEVVSSRVFPGEIKRGGRSMQSSSR